MISREVRECRICKSSDLIPYLDLGMMPLVNSYLANLEEAKKTELKFPLVILFCKSCALSQLSLVISPEVLYREYDYYSSVSKTFQAHCKALAENAVSNLSLNKNDLVVEIASNDGCLLSEFQKAGVRVRGVEPARNLAKISNDRGLPTFSEFWSSDVADLILKTDGPAKTIVCTNVLAHVDDLHGFLAAVKKLLGPDGSFIFEVPYMLHFLHGTAFDTTYHEHLSYFLLAPLRTALEANGLSLVDAEQFDIHGGSIRVSARPSDSSSVSPHSRVQAMIDHEATLGLHSEQVYLQFQNRVRSLREELCDFVAGVKARNKTIAAYGASAKGNVLLNYCGLDSTSIQFVIDDTPAKQGKFYPGVHLPIVPQSYLKDHSPDYLLLLAWNFAKELMENTEEFSRRGGRYLIPIPSLQVAAPSHLAPKRFNEKEKNHLPASV